MTYYISIYNCGYGSNTFLVYLNEENIKVYKSVKLLNNDIRFIPIRTLNFPFTALGHNPITKKGQIPARRGCF